MMGKFARLGLADILAVKDGKAIFWEVKSETGRPRNDQLDFGRDVIAAAAEYRVVRSIEEVQAAGRGRVAMPESDPWWTFLPTFT